MAWKIKRKGRSTLATAIPPTCLNGELEHYRMPLGRVPNPGLVGSKNQLLCNLQKNVRTN